MLVVLTTKTICRSLWAVLKIATFLGFTAYVAVQVTVATGPAIDIFFDLVVWLALVVHLTHRWLRRPTAKPGE